MRLINALIIQNLFHSLNEDLEELYGLNPSNGIFLTYGKTYKICESYPDVQPIRLDCFKLYAQFPAGLKPSSKKKWELTLNELIDYYYNYCNTIGLKGDAPKNSAMMLYTSFQNDLDSSARSGCSKALLPK